MEQEIWPVEQVAKAQAAVATPARERLEREIESQFLADSANDVNVNLGASGNRTSVAVRVIKLMIMKVIDPKWHKEEMHFKIARNLAKTHSGAKDFNETLLGPPLRVPTDVFLWLSWLIQDLIRTHGLSSRWFTPKPAPKGTKPTTTNTHTGAGGGRVSGDRKERNKRKQQQLQQASDKTPADSHGKKLCRKCGRNSHETAVCVDERIPVEYRKYLNHDLSKPYAESDKGKACKEALGKEYIPGISRTEPDAKRQKGHKKCEYSDELLATTNENDTNTDNSSLLFDVIVSAENGSTKVVKAFADPGAIRSSYVSHTLADWLIENGGERTPCERVVCGAIKHTSDSNVVGSSGRNTAVAVEDGVPPGCERTDKCVNIKFRLTPDLARNTLKKVLDVQLPVAAINAKYDLIVGLPDMRRKSLFTILMPLFLGTQLERETVGSTPSENGCGCGLGQCGRTASGMPGCDKCAKENAPVVPSAGVAAEVDGPSLLSGGAGNKVAPEDIPQKPLLYDAAKFPEGKVGSEEEAGWAGPEEIAEYQARFPGIPSKVYGTGEQRKALFELIGKHQIVFNNDIGVEPAVLPCAQFEIDEKLWVNDPKNKLAPRPMSMEKTQVARQKVESMLAKNVIARTTEAKAWSQINLVKKPDGDWRTTMDFRRLNILMKSLSWPIPNINDMIRRFGQRRPRFFAIMDLKEGYHQAPLAVDCRIYTAFITAFGIFHYLRLPMGIKIAAAYFQNVIATIVLARFMYTCVEAYIDDFSVDDEGKGFDQYLKNLDGVLTALGERKMTVSPNKSIFGISQMTFVGHTVDSEGVHFTKEQRDKVADIEPPILGKGLKSFLGLTNWFSQHIENYATRAAPLQKLVCNYEQTKNKKIKWTEETRKVFFDIREAVNNCPKLFFLQDAVDSRIVLQTDASDYGIGAVLIQFYKDEAGVEQKRPIAFMSKALSGAQLNWSTFEKEGYAIIYACRKFHYLIGDRHFVIETDHRNLTFIRDSGSEKVKRWKYELMEYDFAIIYIAGESNVVADGFSRIIKEGAKGFYSTRSITDDETLAESPEILNSLWEHCPDRLGQDSWLPTDVELIFLTTETSEEEDRFTVPTVDLSVGEREADSRVGVTGPGSAEAALKTVEAVPQVGKPQEKSKKNRRRYASKKAHGDGGAFDSTNTVDSQGYGSLPKITPTGLKTTVSIDSGQEGRKETASVTHADSEPTREKLKAAANSTIPIAEYTQRAEPTESLLGAEEFPMSEKHRSLIAAFHGGLHGHGGCERTRTLLVQRGITWKFMRRDIRDFISQCPCCQKMSELRVPIKATPYVLNTTTPMRRIMIDTIGPLTLDGDNNAYIVNIIDCFSRWSELYAQKTVTAEETVFAVLDWCGRFGFPSEIYTDGGTQFCNEIMSEIFNLIGTVQIVCTPYSKEEQGIVERNNKEAARHLRTMIFDRNSNIKWGKRDLPMVQRVLNTSVKGPTGVSPADILFGAALQLDRNMFVVPFFLKEIISEAKKARGITDAARSDGFIVRSEGHVDQKTGAPLSKIAADMLTKQRKIIALAERTQMEANKKNLGNREQRHLHQQETEFAKGSYVLEEFATNPIRRGPKEGKLKPTLRGPLRVAGHTGSEYKVVNLINGKTHATHVSRLRKFTYDPNHTTPREVALRDDNEFLVEDIRGHKTVPGGNIKSKKDMLFLVKWEGYNESQNTWEPWSGVRLVDKLHIYLRKNKMKSWIPKNLTPVETASDTEN